MKKYKKMIILTTLLTGLPILIGLILWSKLPDSMATHWDVNGQANGWSGKGTTVFFSAMYFNDHTSFCSFSDFE